MTLFHILNLDGVLAGVERLFHVIQERYDSSHLIVYFNNNTSATLARALRDSTAAWVKDPERTRQFEFNRVDNVFDLLQKIMHSKCHLVVIENLDAIMQEQTHQEYTEQNDALEKLMATPHNAIFIDSWAYLDTYFYREKL